MDNLYIFFKYMCRRPFSEIFLLSFNLGITGITWALAAWGFAGFDVNGMQFVDKYAAFFVAPLPMFILNIWLIHKVYEEEAQEREEEIELRRFEK